MICQVRDAGHVVDPLAGRRCRPGAQRRTSGHGLLVVNHFADLVRMHTRPDSTTIRAYFHPQLML